MQRKRAATRVWVWTLVTIVLFAALMAGISGFSFAGISLTGLSGVFTYDDAAEYTAGGASVAAGGIREIDIHWVAGAVKVQVYGGDTIQFSETASRALETDEMLHYRIKNGKLILQYRKAGGLGQLLTNTPDKALELLLPSSLVLEELSIENVSSEVDIQGRQTRIRAVDIETVSGSVALSGVYGDLLDVESVSASLSLSGDFAEAKLENVSGSLLMEGSFELIKAEAVSGSQTYRLVTTPNSLRAESVSGSIQVYMAKDAGFRASLDTVSGSIQSDFATLNGRHDASFGDGKGSFQFETVSGNVTLAYDDTLTPRATPTPAPVSPSPSPARTEPAGGTDAIPSSQRQF